MYYAVIGGDREGTFEAPYGQANAARLIHETAAGGNERQVYVYGPSSGIRNLAEAMIFRMIASYRYEATGTL